MKIESIQIKNFKMLKNVVLTNIPNFCVIVGANGTGKTTFFDIFGFLHDCLQHDVTKALSRRGGFKEVISRGADSEQIEIQLQLRMEIEGVSRLVTYILEIGSHKGKGVITREVLRYKRRKYGSPFHFLDFKKGEGFAINNEAEFHKSEDLKQEYQTLDSSDTLAIKGLGQFQRFKAASAIRLLIEKWHVSDFHINAARGSKDITQGSYDHLSESGDNLQLVANNFYENNPDVFNRILEQMRKRVPGIGKITPAATEEGRVLLKFQDGSFKDPFIDKYVSDGTLKMFAYLIMLYDPEAHPLLCVEEPENQLYPKLLWELAEEFNAYARRGGQVFVSSHSPDFLNAVSIDNAYWLEKKDGYTSVNRVNQDQTVINLMQEGGQMGALWREGWFAELDL